MKGISFSKADNRVTIYIAVVCKTVSLALSLALSLRDLCLFLCTLTKRYVTFKWKRARERENRVNIFASDSFAATIISW